MNTLLNTLQNTKNNSKELSNFIDTLLNSKKDFTALIDSYLLEFYPQSDDCFNLNKKEKVQFLLKRIESELKNMIQSTKGLEKIALKGGLTIITKTIKVSKLIVDFTFSPLDDSDTILKCLTTINRALNTIVVNDQGELMENQFLFSKNDLKKLFNQTIEINDFIVPKYTAENFAKFLSDEIKLNNDKLLK